MEEVIEANGGTPPRNLMHQVDKIWQVKKQPLMKEMNKEIKRGLSEAEKARKSGTGTNLAAYGAGKGISILGNLVGKVAKAALGAKVGGALGGSEGRTIGGVTGALE